MVYSLGKALFRGTLSVILGIVLLYTITPEARGIYQRKISTSDRQESKQKTKEFYKILQGGAGKKE